MVAALPLQRGDPTFKCLFAQLAGVTGPTLARVKIGQQVYQVTDIQTHFFWIEDEIQQNKSLGAQS